MPDQQVSEGICGSAWRRYVWESQPHVNSEDGPHLRGTGTWPLRQSTVVPIRIGDRPRVADLADDFREADAAAEGPEYGCNIATHSGNRKRADVARNSTGRCYQRATEGFKLKASNRYPTIVGLVTNHPFNYWE